MTADAKAIPATLSDVLPGLVLSGIVAAAGYLAAPYVGKVVPIPSMVIALVIGIALNPIATRPWTQPGMAFCVRTLLRWAVALARPTRGGRRHRRTRASAQAR